MSFNKIKIDFFVLFILVSIILISYISYILFGGFGSGDDINLVLRALNNNLSELIIFDLLENTANIARPVSMIISDLTHYFFKTNLRLYTASCLLTWILVI